jgi:hypothetical protein
MPPGYRVFRRLAPGPWFNSVTHVEYLQLFAREILAPLNPRQTWNELHEMADGAEPVLLCYERPEDLAAGKTFCHRRQVAAWFEEELGVTVSEISPAQLCGLHEKRLPR